MSTATQTGSDESRSFRYTPDKEASHRTRCRPILLTAIATLLLTGCYDKGDERAYPYRFQIEYKFYPWTLVKDLDYKGGDEILSRIPYEQEPGFTSYVLFSGAGLTIGQLNVPGEVICSPSFVELDGDRQNLEILVPANRNDSLYLYVYDAKGEQYGQPVLIAHGSKRVDPDGSVYDWKAAAHFWTLDVNGDTENELVAVVNTTFARSPRGVFIFDLPSMKPLGSELVGAALEAPDVMGDIDRDGKLEFLLHSGTPKNGANEGGLDDSHGHLILIELSEDPRMEWVESAPVPLTQYRAYSGKFAPDGSEGILVTIIGSHAARPVETNIRLYEFGRPLGAQIPLKRTIDDTLLATRVADLDGDGLLELYALNTSGVLLRLIPQGVTRPLPFGERARNLEIIPDITGDGAPELSIVTVDGKTRVLDSELRVIGLSNHSLGAFVITTPSGEKHILTADGKALSMSYSASYLMFRYGWSLGGVFCGLLVLALVMLAYRRGRRSTIQEIVRSDFGSFRFPVFRIDDGDTIAPLNDAATKFGDPGGKLPDFDNQLSNGIGVKTSPSVLSLDATGHESLQCILLPVTESTSLLFVLESESVYLAEGWRRMTSRIAHDIKNPLTSILLTVQRLQAESEALGPDAQVSMQPLLGRIEDRIDHLRRKSRQIMKVAGTVEETPAAVRINEVLERIIESISGAIPGDIDIVERLGEELPPIIFDPDLIESVIENVVMNAVQAMPDGGRLTITSERLDNYRVNETGKAGLYVCVSISDTGVGISPRDIEHVFDPGYSSKEEHSGLGLTFVKNIIEQHSGHIRVDSEVGSGTEFAICLAANETE